MTDMVLSYPSEFPYLVVPDFSRGGKCQYSGSFSTDFRDTGLSTTGWITTILLSRKSNPSRPFDIPTNVYHKWSKWDGSKWVKFGDRQGSNASCASWVEFENVPAGKYKAECWDGIGETTKPLYGLFFTVHGNDPDLETEKQERIAEDTKLSDRITGLTTWTEQQIMGILASIEDVGARAEQSVTDLWQGIADLEARLKAWFADQVLELLLKKLMEDR